MGQEINRHHDNQNLHFAIPFSKDLNALFPSGSLQDFLKFSNSTF